MFLEEQVQPSNLPQKIDDNSNFPTDHQSLQYEQNVMFESSPATGSLPKNTDGIQTSSGSRSPLSDSKSPLPDLRSPLPDSKSPLPDSRSPLPESRSPIPDSNSPLQKNLMKLENQHSSTLIPLVTTARDWMEDMELNWATVVARSNLLSLRNFTQDGMMISVVEEKVSL